MKELAGQTGGRESFRRIANAPDLHREGLEDGSDVGESLGAFEPGASVHVGEEASGMSGSDKEKK